VQHNTAPVKVSRMIAPAQLSMIAVKRLIAGDGISDFECRW